MALAGETGSGKSSLALALLGLFDESSHVESGEILFQGFSLRSLRESDWKGVRGRKIGMIFQDARSALNPVLTIESHLVETIRAHQEISKKEARARAIDLLRDVGISSSQLSLYPFQLSGGECQRIGIALAICNNPRLLIADEPTSAVDSTIQAQILDLLELMKQRYGLALLMISHDLPLLSQVADRISIMYHGRIIESGLGGEIFASPGHPYTQTLIQCQPTLHHHHEIYPLSAIPGAVPMPGENFPGCAFAPRCNQYDLRCTESVPAKQDLSKTHWVACIKNGKDISERSNE